jgi:hypothetical protein
LLDNPRAIVNRDFYAVLFAELVLELGAFLGPREARSDAKNLLISALSCDDALYVAANLFYPLLLGTKSKRPPLAPGVWFTDLR